MEIKLYLARHAHASDHASDELRPLSEKGRKQARRLAKGLLHSGQATPAANWHSHLRRAVETAEILGSLLAPETPLREKRGFAPYDSPAATLALVDALRESTMIVGHEPQLSGLAGLLLATADGKPFDRIALPKASILCLSRMVAGDQATRWQIEWHVHHKLFK